MLLDKTKITLIFYGFRNIVGLFSGVGTSGSEIFFSNDFVPLNDI